MVDTVWSNIFNPRRQDNGILGILRGIPIFEGLSHRHLVAIERILHRREYAADEVIFHQDDAGVGMYIIETGTVSIHASGQQLAELHDGEFFGEIGLLTEFPRSATAQAVTSSKLLFLSQTDLFGLLERQPKCGTKVVVQVAEIIGRRLMATNEVLHKLRAELVSTRKELEGLRAEEPETEQEG